VKGLTSTPQGDETLRCSPRHNKMNSPIYKPKIQIQLTKLRSTLQYLEHIDPINLAILPDIIILWGEIAISTEGLNFDGTLSWKVTVKHIINIGIPTVVQYLRRQLTIESQERILNFVRALVTTVNSFNHGWKGKPTKYDYTREQRRRSWDLQTTA